MRRFVAAAVLLSVVAGFAGCSTLGYYWQALGGQVELSHKARPIPQVLADAKTPTDVKLALERVQAIRAFAVRELHLPDNGSYRRYADLQRPYVVWNVFATAEFSTEPEQWCFPIAGCVGYRGYFAQADADAFAAGLRAAGLDVYVGGVPAYSTLGWMDDPVLSTFVRYPQAQMAQLIFHELAHQVVYLPGDSTFNESFAVTVESEGVRRWLAHTGAEQGMAALDVARARKQAFLQLVTRYRERLAALYASGEPAAAMRADKARTFAALRADYDRLKHSWDGYAGYDGWFDQPLNNAQLASVAIYTDLVPAFQQLLAECDGDLPRFYAAVAQLAKLDPPAREAQLARLSRTAAG